jgi:hypothetical protein
LQSPILAEYLGASTWRKNGLGKRFAGIDAERRVAAFETANPPERYETA